MIKNIKAFDGKKSGFTLIEMLIVIAVIAILAGVVLTGVSGFQASARDTSRIGDVRNIQNLLELWFTRNAEYPATLAELDTIGNIPTDPATGEDYGYYLPTDDQLSYCLVATLEGKNSGAIDDATGSDDPCPDACNDGEAGNVFCSTSN